MSGIRIQSQGPAGRLGAAMIPVPAHGFAEWSSWGAVTGGPRIQVPSPPPPITQNYTYTALHKSRNAPAYWRPGIYFQAQPPAAPGNPQSGSGMAANSDNQMPVPAVPPRGKPAIMARSPYFTRQKQLGWPVVTPSFSWRNS